jgi:hypothetical protein
MTTATNDISYARDFCLNCGHYHRKDNSSKPFDCMLGHDCKCKEKNFLPRRNKGSFG